MQQYIAIGTVKEDVGHTKREYRRVYGMIGKQRQYNFLDCTIDKA